MVTPDEERWRSLYRTGAVALMVAGAWYVVLTVGLLVIIARGEYLDSSQALMEQIIETPHLPRLNAAMAIVADGSQVLGFVVLMLALRHVDLALPIVALLPISVAAIYDMQDGLLEWGMTHSYAAYPTATGTAQTAYEVQAEDTFQYIYEVATPFMAIMIGISVALVSWTIRRSDFHPWTAYLGFAVAAVAIIGGLTTIFPLLLAVSTWYLAVGIQLFRRSRTTGSIDRSPVTT
jgi:hypothetical protein